MTALANRATKRIYPSPDTHYWLNAEESTGSTNYRYPQDGRGATTVTESEAVWNDLGLSAGTFYVKITALDIIGAGASQVFILPIDGTTASVDALTAGILSGVSAHLEPGVTFEDGFRACLLLAASTSTVRVFFQVIEVATADNLDS